METLKLSLAAGRAPRASRRRVPKLLNLASERQAEQVEIDGLYFPLRVKSLSNPSLKILKLGHSVFDNSSNYPPLSLNSLRFLRLESVGCCDQKLLENLIDSSPLLETLELVRADFSHRLSVSADHTKLKTLEISYCYRVMNLEIAAPGLETLRLQSNWLLPLSNFELAAPRLNLLEISNFHCTAGEVAAVISNLQSLKSLTLTHLQLADGLKLKLSNPELERFTLHVPELEQIVLDAGPTLTEFILRVDDGHKSLNVLNKCKINPSCRWELDFKHGDLSNLSFAALKNFGAKFSHFYTIDLTSDVNFKATFEEEKLRYKSRLVSIKHLKVVANRRFGDDQKARLNGLLWALSPKFLTIIYERSCYSVSSLLDYLKSRAPCQKAFRGKKLYKNGSWRDRLKDVTVINGDIDGRVVNEVEDEEELKNVLKSVARPATQDQVCFMLTWG